MCLDTCYFKVCQLLGKLNWFNKSECEIGDDKNISWNLFQKFCYWTCCWQHFAIIWFTTWLNSTIKKIHLDNFMDINQVLKQDANGPIIKTDVIKFNKHVKGTNSFGNFGEPLIHKFSLAWIICTGIFTLHFGRFRLSNLVAPHCKMTLKYYILI